MGVLGAVVLDSGMRAEIRVDAYTRDGIELVVDGTPQSHVDREDPEHLVYEYVRRMGNVIDLVAPPRAPVTVVHLGAGALTLARYVHATRPGSPQHVIELERAVVDLVRAHAPLPPRAPIRVRYGDARERLGSLPPALRGAADVVVVDVFGGERIPAHVTSVEFYREAVQLLSPSGVVLVNVADGSGAAFARGQAATLAHECGDLLVLADAPVASGRRFGNFVLVGARETLPGAWFGPLHAAGPHPGALLHDDELTRWIAAAPIVTDAGAVPSPSPQRSVFQVSSARSRRSREAGDDG